MEYEKNDPVRLTGDGTAIEILDQTLLPGMEKTVRLRSAQEIAEAIGSLRVRGAPMIGVCAAYGVFVCAKRHLGDGDMWDQLEEDAELIASARPTAVNLRRQVERMMTLARAHRDDPELVGLLQREAERIHEEDIAVCRIIAEFGLTLIQDGSTVITHCNAGALAASRYGTGLGPLLLGAERGYTLHAYVDETRPLLQGARLTAYELVNAGVDTTLMCDNMAAYLMSRGKVDACLVGCDRLAANGDAANKIGTYSLAVAAKHFGVPFYVFCPCSTIDLGCGTGADIVIEERPGEEITELNFSRPMGPRGVKCFNPAFDVTPAELITAIVTEKGVLRPPYRIRDIMENG